MPKNYLTEIREARIRHARLKKVAARFDDGLTTFKARSFWRGRKRLKGLCPYLGIKGVDKKRKRGKFCSIKRECKTFGREHGTLVHRQVEKAIKTIANPSLRLRTPTSLDPCTLRFFAALRVRGLTPLRGEVPASWSGIGTAADVVAWDEKAKCVAVLELKTEYENEDYYQEKGKVRGIGDSLHARHCLQAQWTRHIVEKDYRVPVKKAYVVRTLPKRRVVEIHPVPSSYLR